MAQYTNKSSNFARLSKFLFFNFLKKIFIILCAVALALIALPTAAVFTVQHPKVQQYLVNEAAKTLSNKLRTKVSVGSVRFRLFNRLVLNDVYVQGLSGDTLIFVSRLTGSLTNLHLPGRYVEVGTLSLSNARLHLEKDTAGVFNLGSLISRLKSHPDSLPPKEASERPFHLQVHNVEADELSFSYIDHRQQGAESDSAIDFKHVIVNDISFRVSDLSMAGDTMQCRLEYLRFRERSGFHLRRMSGDVSVAPTFIEVKKLAIRDDFSDINAKYYRMDYDSFADFFSYVEKVKMSADFTASDVDLYTIAFFAPKMAKLHLNVTLTGLVGGEVSNLKGNGLLLGFGRGTEAKVNFSMQGLPDPQNTFFMFDVKNLTSNPEDIATTDLLALNHRYAKHSALLQQLGKVQGKARFTGFLSNFVADGALRSEIGTLIGDLSFTPAADSAMLINGTLGTDNFHLGKLLNDSIMGKINFYGKVSGTFKSIHSLSLNADLNIPLVELYGYPYRSTKLKGLITEKSFRGELLCGDANMSLDFSGIANFEQEKSQFDFKLQLHHADFAATGLNRRDSLSQLTLAAVANLEGNSIDNFSGNLTISSAKYTSSLGELPVASIRLTAKHSGNTESLSLKSDVLEANLSAKGHMVNIVPALDSVLRYFIPACHNLLQAPPATAKMHGKAQQPPKAAKQPEKFEYTFSLLTKNAEKLQQLVTPSITIADGTSLSGCISSDISRVTLALNAPGIRYDELAFAGVRLNVEPQNSSLSLTLKAVEASGKGLKLHDWEMTGTLQNSLLALTSGYKTSAAASGLLKTQVAFFENGHGKKGMDVELFPSTLALSDMLWSLSESRVRIEDKRYAIDGFTLGNDRQQLHVNGVISSSTGDTLLCELRNLSVAPLMRTLPGTAALTGVVSGSIAVRGMLAPMPLFLADLKASAVTFAKNPVGDVTLHTSIAENEKDVSVQLRIDKDGEENLNVTGTLKSNGEAQAQATLNKLCLHHVSPMMTGTLSDIGGTLSGALNVTGPLKRLQLNGKLLLSQGQLKVDYLNSTFKMSGPVALENSTLQISGMTVTDDANNTGKLSFTLANLTTPADLRYSLKIAPNNFHVFNTTARHNDYFYGQGYATGTVQIDGKPDETGINVAATTNDKTSLSILLGSKAQVQSRNFIDFVTPDDKVEPQKEEAPARKTNIKVDVNLHATNDANLTLVLNQNTGNAIKATGSGNIKFEIEPAKNVFRMFGSYAIQRGEYSISIQNIVNKKFKIDNGSTIGFNGDPAAATANIHATYKVRAPLSDLFSDTTGRYDRAIPIDCKVSLTGNLADPELKFEIDAPTADNETKDRMQAQLSTEDNMTMQFLSLLLIDRFIPQQNISGYGQTIGNITLGGLVSSQVFSQITDLMSRFANISFSMGLNDSYEDPDWELSLNKDITDRITLSANLEHQSQRNQLNPNGSEYLSRDVDLEVTLDKSGRVRVKAFSHSNDQYTEMVAGSNRYGVGVFYQEDFDSFADLWKSIFHSKKRKKKPDEAIVTSQENRQKPDAPPDNSNGEL
jgi:hypothetical protein